MSYIKYSPSLVSIPPFWKEMGESHHRELVLSANAGLRLQCRPPGLLKETVKTPLASRTREFWVNLGKAVFTIPGASQLLPLKKKCCCSLTKSTFLSFFFFSLFPPLVKFCVAKGNLPLKDLSKASWETFIFQSVDAAREPQVQNQKAKQKKTQDADASVRLRKEWVVTVMMAAQLAS